MRGNRVVATAGKERLVIGLAIIVILIMVGLTVGVIDTVHLFILGLNAMVPIALAAVGEVLTERGGLFNIGIEGIMLLASFGAVYAAEVSGNWFVGLLAGLLVGALVAYLFALIATYGAGNQVVAGVGINMLALGLVAYFLVVVWGSPGFHLLSSYEIRVPKINVLGSSVSWMIIVVLGITVAVHFVLENTRFGLRVKAAGYNPFVTDVSGIDVYKLRTLACVIGGVLAGLGGAYMSLDWLGLSASSLIQGRGFIALACVVFGGLDPILTLEAAYLFGLLSATGLWLQNIPWAAPLMLRGGSYLFLMLPYLAVLAVLIVFPRRQRLSKEIGVPYRRG
ncbi:MAG: ral nucleoside transport system permease protein [Candidatus Atribacteria bacterium]|nr:ral nucleoside transport system permease protein [Candidatus Atribacteria bacterium]